MNRSRPDTAILHLVLKARWFHLIASGRKREEYRDVKPFWTKRLENWNRAKGKHVVEFRLGYSTNAPRMVFLARRSGGAYFSVSERTVSEWGEGNRAHYVIKLGKRIA